MATPFAPPLSSSTSLAQFKHSSPVDDASGAGYSSSASSYVSLNPSLFVIFAIVAFVFCASASIHLLLRFLSVRRRRRSSSLPPLPPLLLQRRNNESSSVSSSSSSASAAAAEMRLPASTSISNKDKAALIDSLPLFTLAALPKASSDCAVCLYPFRPHDELRLLPACRHAFHSRCLDPWLQSTPSCPLCRASVALPAPPLPPPDVVPCAAPSRSGSYRVEIGSVSRRAAPPPETELAAGNPRPHLRAYSLGSSLEYVVNEEVDAVVELIGARRREKVEKQEDVGTVLASQPEAAPRAAGVAEAAGEEGEARGSQRENVDQFSSLSLSPLSSFRFSSRWSHRCDGDGGGRVSWDLEGSGRQEAEDDVDYGFYGWILGA